MRRLSLKCGAANDEPPEETEHKSERTPHDSRGRPQFSLIENEVAPDGTQGLSLNS